MKAKSVIAILFLAIVLLLTYYGYNQMNQPELIYVGVDYWQADTNDVSIIFRDVKTNELYLENTDGTNRRKWTGETGNVKIWEGTK